MTRRINYTFGNYKLRWLDIAMSDKKYTGVFGTKLTVLMEGKIRSKNKNMGYPIFNKSSKFIVSNSYGHDPNHIKDKS